MITLSLHIRSIAMSNDSGERYDIKEKIGEG